MTPEEGLPAQCSEFKCPPNRVDCCCRRVFFIQPDFVNQHSQLQELIERHGHLCDFYPKYHCELNFIEQYWGAAKAQYRVAPRAKNIQKMEDTVKECLDSVPLDQIRWSVLILLFLFTSHNSLPHLGLPIELCVSSQLTGRGFQAPKPHG